MQHGRVLSPAEVSERERLFEKDGILRWSNNKAIGYCRIGVPLHMLLSRIGSQQKYTGSSILPSDQLSELLSLFADESYLLWPGASAEDEALIVLKAGCTPIDQLRAWAHALSIMQSVQGGSARNKRDGNNASHAQVCIAELRRTLEDTRSLFSKYTDILVDQGWDLEVGALETLSGTRVYIKRHEQTHETPQIAGLCQ